MRQVRPLVVIAVGVFGHQVVVGPVNRLNTAQGLNVAPVNIGSLTTAWRTHWLTVAASYGPSTSLDQDELIQLRRNGLGFGSGCHGSHCLTPVASVLPTVPGSALSHLVSSFSSLVQRRRSHRLPPLVRVESVRPRTSRTAGAYAILSRPLLNQTVSRRLISTLTLEVPDVDAQTSTGNFPRCRTAAAGGVRGRNRDRCSSSASESNGLSSSSSWAEGSAPPRLTTRCTVRGLTPNRCAMSDTGSPSSLAR